MALNPVIKFTTLFGLLAVELAEELKHAGHEGPTLALAFVLFVVSFVFVYRSFYGMRIETPMSVLTGESPKTGAKAA